MADRILVETRFLRCIDRDGWFFVERPHGAGVVTIVPITDDGRVILVEQRRPAVGGPTIEWPAGLAGDEPGHEHEDLAAAARRELIEETGYDAGRLDLVAACPTSPGLTSEIVTFFVARDLKKIAAGGGIGQENIQTHEVPLSSARAWLRAREQHGVRIAAKVFAGLYFALEALAGESIGSATDKGR